jgi:hypothetical protein
MHRSTQGYCRAGITVCGTQATYPTAESLGIDTSLARRIEDASCARRWQTTLGIGLNGILGVIGRHTGIGVAGKAFAWKFA